MEPNSSSVLNTNGNDRSTDALHLPNQERVKTISRQ
jgi:hypothetical protein